MFTKPIYLIAFLSVLTTAQEIPAGVSSSLGAINPTALSSAASVLSASSASVASAKATSTGGANAHEVKYAALFGVGGAALNAFM
ncbi:unnamed protein product [Alternaria alternata]